MANRIRLIGTLLAATTLAAAGFAAQAANVPHPMAQQTCAASMAAGNPHCARAKSATPAPLAGLLQVANGRLDRNSCNRLSNKVARDTCLNHVDGSA